MNYYEHLSDIDLVSYNVCNSETLKRLMNKHLLICESCRKRLDNYNSIFTKSLEELQDLVESRLITEHLTFYEVYEYIFENLDSDEETKEALSEIRDEISLHIDRCVFCEETVDRVYNFFLDFQNISQIDKKLSLRISFNELILSVIDKDASDKFKLVSNFQTVNKLLIALRNPYIKSIYEELDNIRRVCNERVPSLLSCSDENGNDLKLR